MDDDLDQRTINGLLGSNPPLVSGQNVKLTWFTNAMGHRSARILVRAFMLFFISHVLAPNIGSTVSLCYLPSLDYVTQIGWYDWGGMAYGAMLHYVAKVF